MIIHNGFLKLVNGDWVNLSSIHGFRVQSAHPKKNEFYIVAIFLKENYLQEVDSMKYRTEKEAQEILDFHMTRKGLI